VAVALAGAAALIWLPERNDRPADGTGTTTPVEPTPVPAADLSLSTPMSTPDCDGGYIVIVASAINQDRYEETVQRALDAHPNARYLHAPTTGCTSLRHRLNDVDIYSVYYGPYPTDGEACARRAEVGGESFVRRLDNTSTPDRGVSCG
jgi:serine/threonine-protein kinase